MSYILEALKKSDQQRQRGATPTLQAAQVTVAVPKRPMSIYYGLLAALVLVAGIMIGWLHPWQPEPTFSVPTLVVPTLPGTEPIAAKSPIQIPQHIAPAPLPAPLEMLGKTGTFSTPMPEKPASADLAQEQRAIPIAELPLTIQQEIPAMTIQLHAYSSNPGERLVSINSIRLREGENLMVGLRLEQITPDGMIFSYKGYRFQRDIR